MSYLDSYNNTFSTNIHRLLNYFIDLVKHDGPLAIWKEYLSRSIAYGLMTALLFTFKGAYSKSLNLRSAGSNIAKFFLVSSLIGGISGVSTLLFIYPIDHAIMRKDDTGLGIRRYKGTIDCLTKLYKSEELAGLYKGFVVSAVGTFLYEACKLGGYDTAKKFFWKDFDKAGFLTRLLLAQVVTLIATSVSYPFHIVKNRIMDQSTKSDNSYGELMKSVKKTYREHGALRFFRVDILEMLSQILAAGLTLVVYDVLVKKVVAK